MKLKSSRKQENLNNKKENILNALGKIKKPSNNDLVSSKLNNASNININISHNDLRESKILNGSNYNSYNSTKGKDLITKMKDRVDKLF